MLSDLERREGPQPPRLHNERRRRSDDGTRAPRSARDRELIARKSLFADNARFWSMVAIVGLHSADVIHTLFPDPSKLDAIRVLQTFEKAGTIGFFFVSGFLLDERIETTNRLSFLGRRLQKICLPWLVWFTMLVCKSVAGQQFWQTIRLRVDLASAQAILLIAKGCLVATSFWFVPNMFFSLCLLMLFRRHLRSLWLGAALLCMTVFYGLNVYTHWIRSSHETALGGYVFFLWLGALASRNYAGVAVILERIKIPYGALAAVALGFLSLWDSELIRRFGVGDEMNTLRPTNILFSLAVLLLIAKFTAASWPARIDVRGQMFGVYLSHWIVLTTIAGPFIHFHLLPTPAGGVLGAVEKLAGAIAITIGVFSISLSITEFIRQRPTLAWLVGDTSRGRPVQPAGATWAQSPPEVLPDTTIVQPSH